MWCILPGLALAPSDFEPLKQSLAASLPDDASDIRILDSWKVPVTGPIQAIRSHLLHDVDACEPVNLIGHSVGGLAGLEWLLQAPKQVQHLILLDPTAPEPSPWIWRWATRAHEKRILSPASRRVFIRSATQLVARTAPRLRSFLFRSLSTPNHMSTEEAQERYGSPRAIAQLYDQFMQSWTQQDRIAAAVSARSTRVGGQALSAKTPILQLVGVGPHDRAFIAQQRRLGEHLGSEVHCLMHTNHLFPISQPHIVTGIIERWMRR